MRKHDIESRKQAPSRDSRPELTEAELSQVSGGNLATMCCTGKHISTGKITV